MSEWCVGPSCVPGHEKTMCDGGAWQGGPGLSSHQSTEYNQGTTSPCPLRLVGLQSLPLLRPAPSALQKVHQMISMGPDLHTES